MSSTSEATGFKAGRMSPEFPMHVMQPNPQVKKPRARRSSVSPARDSRSEVAWLPGARMRLIQGFVVRPAACALRAVSPAATIIAGSVAVVQLVMAAMARAPLPMRYDFPSAHVTSQERERSSTP